jgi:VRR-NUC domain
MNTGAVKIPVPGGRDRFLRFGFPGCPDIIGQLIDGRLLAVEVKSPTGRPTTEQTAFLKRVADNGGVAVLAKSVDDVVAALMPS